jgi:hypothetical protein
MEGTSMSRILTIAISALMLVGCASTDSYDRAAKPAAREATRHAIDGCKARLAAHEIKSNSEWASCGLAAERGYFTAIKLKNIGSFDAYATNYQTLAADLDANRISKKRASLRAREMLRQFYVACDCGDNGGFGPIEAPGSYNPPPGNSMSGTIAP